MYVCMNECMDVPICISIYMSSFPSVFLVASLYIIIYPSLSIYLYHAILL